MYRVICLSLLSFAAVSIGCDNTTTSNPVDQFKVFTTNLGPALDAYYADKGGLSSPLKFDVQKSTSVISPYGGTLTYGHRVPVDNQMRIVQDVTVDYLYGDGGWKLSHYKELTVDVEFGAQKRMEMPARMLNELKASVVGNVPIDIGREELHVLPADIREALQSIESPESSK